MTANWFIACEINFKAKPSHLSAVIMSRSECASCGLCRRKWACLEISVCWGNASSLYFQRETTFIVFPGRRPSKEQFLQPWNRLLLSRVTIRVSNFLIFMFYLRETPKKVPWERRLCRGLTHISPMKLLNKSRLNFILTNVGTRCSQCCRANSIFFFVLVKHII